MRTLHLNIPDSVDLNNEQLIQMIASKLYEEGILSSGQAAEIAGTSKRAFIEILGKFGVSVISKSTDDLESDIDNA